MPRSWIVDLRHFLDDAGLPVEGPPGRLARYWCDIVEAATVRPDDAWGATAARCPRTRCPGRVAVRPSDATGMVEWECATCGDNGLISGWAATAWDLRWAAADRPGPLIDVRLSHDEYACLRGCEAVSVEAPVPLAAATLDGDAVVLGATEAELDEALGLVAAEANQARGRRRRALDAVYARLEDALTGRAAPPATAPRDAIARATGRAAADTMLDIGFRERIDALFVAMPAPVRQQRRLALDLGELVDRIRATGASRPEVACAAAGHLLGRFRAAADGLADTPEMRAVCAQLGETAVALARRARADRSRVVLASLLDAYLDDQVGRLHDVPAVLRRARFGTRLRRWLAAETVARSDTADPARAARCAALLAAVADGA